MSIGEVVLLGFGTVFIGLILLILVIMLMGKIVSSAESKKKVPEKAAPAAAPVQNDGIANRQEFVAAVSAAIATVMGTDVSGLRIKSIKKM